MRTMLIPVDDIERAHKAVQHALRIATPNTQVHLLGIMNAPEKQFVDPVAWNIAKSGILSLLNNLGTYLENAGIVTTSDLLENPALDTFIGYIEQYRSDLVILGAEADGNAPLMATLLRLSSVPVLIARNMPKHNHYKKILVPLDESQRAECVLPLVSTLTKNMNAKLVLAHVIRKPEMPRRTFMSSEDVELAQRLVERNQIEAEQYLSQIALRQVVETQIYLLVDDNVSSALHNLIESEGIDLVILSAHGYSGEPRVPLGATASNLINLCSVSMIVIQDLPATIPTAPLEMARK